jgi:uncharacterized protein YlxW (UPF0749 family)
MEVKQLKGYIGTTNRRLKHCDKLIASLQERNKKLKQEIKYYKKEFKSVTKILKSMNKLIGVYLNDGNNNTSK